MQGLDKSLHLHGSGGNLELEGSGLACSVQGAGYLSRPIFSDALQSGLTPCFPLPFPFFLRADLRTHDYDVIPFPGGNST